MSLSILLFNPHSANDRGERAAQALSAKLGKGNVRMVDLTAITDYPAFFAAAKEEGARLILCGGDGTLSHFLADTDGMEIPEPLYFAAGGSGNDFWRDIGFSKKDPPADISPYLQELPRAEIAGRTLRFINGVGCGLDGYCCVTVDRTRAKGFRKIPYLLVAALSLLFAYKPTDAVVTVDGEQKRYERVWLVSAMQGRYFGGGVGIAPNQNRCDSEGALSAVVVSGCSRARIISLFPSIFSGSHLKYTEYVHVLKGHEIKMEFARPVSAQLDGETFLDITSCTAHSVGWLRNWQRQG